MKEVKQNSVYFSNDNSNLDFEFVVLYDNGKSEFINTIKNYINIKESDNKNETEIILDKVKSDIERYPFRLFIVSDDITKDNMPEFLQKRFVLFTNTEFKNALKFEENGDNYPNNYEEFKLWLYSKWIEHLRKIRGLQNDNIKLLLNLRGADAGGNNGEKIAEIVFVKFKKVMVRFLSELEDDNASSNSLKNKTWENIKQQGESTIKEDNELSSAIIKSISINNGDCFRALITSLWESTKEIFMKNEEKIETLPKLLIANENTDGKWNIPKFLKDNIKIADSEGDNDINISYNRHFLKEDANKYSEALSGSQIYFSILSNIGNNDFLKSKVIMQLLENALLRVLIIDERVAQYQANYEEAKKDIFEKMGITIPYKIYYKEDKKPLFLTEKDSNAIESETTGEEEKDTFIIDNSSNKNKTGNKEKNENESENKKGLFVNETEKNEFDLLIIHQGVLEKLLGTDKEKIGKFLNDIKEKIPFVLVTSGRGMPPTLPDDAKLLAFSNIESFLLKDYPEKFLLSQIVMKIVNK